MALWNNVAIPAFEKEIKAKGYKSVVLDAKDNLGQQGANFENLLTLGVSSMVMLPVSGPEAVSFVLTGEGAGREDHRVQRRDHGSRRGGIRRPRQRQGRRVDRARRR